MEKRSVHDRCDGAGKPRRARLLSLLKINVSLVRIETRVGPYYRWCQCVYRQLLREKVSRVLVVVVAGKEIYCTKEAELFSDDANQQVSLLHHPSISAVDFAAHISSRHLPRSGRALVRCVEEGKRRALGERLPTRR